MYILHTTFLEVSELERFQTAKVTFTGEWLRYHSIGHLEFPVGLPLQLCFYLAPLPRYYHFSKFKEVT